MDKENLAKRVRIKNVDDKFRTHYTDKEYYVTGYDKSTHRYLVNVEDTKVTLAAECCIVSEWRHGSHAYIIETELTGKYRVKAYYIEPIQGNYYLASRLNNPYGSLTKVYTRHCKVIEIDFNKIEENEMNEEISTYLTFDLHEFKALEIKYKTCLDLLSLFNKKEGDYLVVKIPIMEDGNDYPLSLQFASNNPEYSLIIPLIEKYLDDLLNKSRKALNDYLDNHRF